MLSLEQILRSILKGDSSLYLIKSSAITTDLTPAGQQLTNDQVVRSLFTDDGSGGYQLGYYISTEDTNAEIGTLDWIMSFEDLFRTISLYNATTGKFYINLIGATYAQTAVDEEMKHLSALDYIKTLICVDSNGNYGIRYMPTTA